ncbi:MAG: hypothetical protein F6K56_24910 [Moorea sp. SIO3G5]|nr:hypothetical protein [Moorena sp. SIO3G5]
MKPLRWNKRINSMDNYSLNCTLTFCNRTQAHLNLCIVNIALTTQEDTINECHLTLQVNPTSYQQIDTHALFNLNPEFRSPFSKGDFSPDHDIQLEITLKPDLLPQLSEHATTPEAAATYLANLSQQTSLPPTASPSEAETQSPSSFNPLLNTENWFCLSVKQQQDSGETGYTTFWNYVNPTILNHPATASKHISEGITNFA